MHAYIAYLDCLVLVQQKRKSGFSVLCFSIYTNRPRHVHFDVNDSLRANPARSSSTTSTVSTDEGLRSPLRGSQPSREYQHSTSTVAALSSLRQLPHRCSHYSFVPEWCGLGTRLCLYQSEGSDTPRNHVHFT